MNKTPLCLTLALLLGASTSVVADTANTIKIMIKNHSAYTLSAQNGITHSLTGADHSTSPSCLLNNKSVGTHTPTDTIASDGLAHQYTIGFDPSSIAKQCSLQLKDGNGTPYETITLNRQIQGGAITMTAAPAAPQYKGKVDVADAPPGTISLTNTKVVFNWKSSEPDRIYGSRRNIGIHVGHGAQKVIFDQSYGNDAKITKTLSIDLSTLSTDQLFAAIEKTDGCSDDGRDCWDQKHYCPVNTKYHDGDFWNYPQGNGCYRDGSKKKNAKDYHFQIGQNLQASQNIEYIKDMKFYEASQPSFNSFVLDTVHMSAKANFFYYGSTPATTKPVTVDLPLKIYATLASDVGGVEDPVSSSRSGPSNSQQTNLGKHYLHTEEVNFTLTDPDSTSLNNLYNGNNLYNSHNTINWLN